jgi:RNA polymerase primary sigma factor
MKTRKVKKAHTNGKYNNSDENVLRLYLNEINRIPLLTKEEEEKTAKLAAQGNKAAREKLVNANLRFVISIAKKYQGKGMPLEDLISEGNMGLLSAVDRFDIDKGFRFITYAVWWIRQSIVKALNEKGRMIRLPSNKSNELTRINRTMESILNEPGCKTNAEIEKVAMYLEMSPEKAGDLIQINQDVVSLDDPAQKFENSMTIKDLIEDECSATPIENAINCILKDQLEIVIKDLEKRAADVLRCRYGLENSNPLTLKEIGDRFNLSRERVRQIEKRALVQIQQSPQRSMLESFIA